MRGCPLSEDSSAVGLSVVVFLRHWHLREQRQDCVGTEKKKKTLHLSKHLRVGLIDREALM